MNKELQEYKFLLLVLFQILLDGILISAYGVMLVAFGIWTLVSMVAGLIMFIVDRQRGLVELEERNNLYSELKNKLLDLLYESN